MASGARGLLDGIAISHQYKLNIALLKATCETILNCPDPIKEKELFTLIPDLVDDVQNLLIQYNDQQSDADLSQSVEDEIIAEMWREGFAIEDG